MRSPAEMDIAVIDITTSCMLRCSNCTRFVAHFPKQYFMPPEDFRTAIRSLTDWWRPGKVIGIIGGEPTLHPQFEEICRIFVEEFGDRTPLTHGREPIADYNAFAQERLFDRSNGRGLWSTPHESFYRHFEVIHDTFSHFNLNDHMHEGLHKALMITRDELGIPDNVWYPMRDACWVQNTWSAGIRNGKVWFCEVAAALDQLYFAGSHGIPIHDGWWSRKPDQFIGPAGDQRKLCELCCACVKDSPSAVASDETDIVSPWHKAALEKIGSPAIRKNAIEVYQIATPEPPKESVARTDNREHRKDRYIPEQSPRVSSDNRRIRPHKLSGVVVSVGYGELLERNIFQNTDHFDELVIVTSTDDLLTQQVANNAKSKVVITDRCYADNHAFNKGRMLNAGFEALSSPDWIIFHDADVLLHKDTGSFIRSHVLNPGCLYYTDRHESRSPANINSEPNGYFQLWNVRAQSIRDAAKRLKPCAETFCSAASVDSHFMQQWHPSKRIHIPSIPVTHSDHGPFASNWNGTQFRPGWNYIGSIASVSQLKSFRSQSTPQSRITSTKDASSADAPLNQDQFELFANHIRQGFHLNLATYKHSPH